MAIQIGISRINGKPIYKHKDLYFQEEFPGSPYANRTMINRRALIGDVEEHLGACFSLDLLKISENTNKIFNLNNI